MSRLPCDGTWQDYKRHRNRGEDACQESKKAWRKRQRAVRQRLKGKGKA